jgi:uncharacterized membrane protein
MDEKAIEQKIAELVHEVSENAPNESHEGRTLSEAQRERQAKLKATVSSLQDSLDYLRLAVKYLMFDLEATRRENHYLRKMLEEEPES